MDLSIQQTIFPRCKIPFNSARFHGVVREMRKQRNWGIQYYDHEAHGHVWYDDVDRMGYPKRQFISRKDAVEYIFKNGLLFTYPEFGELLVLEVPE